MKLWPKNVTYKVFDRHFNLSTHYYKTNDLVLKDEALKNLQVIADNLKVDKIIALNQVHSNKIIEIKDASQDYGNVSADGSITNLRGLGLAVYTADCLPVVITNTKGTIIAALHIGRKGALSNIVFNFKRIVEEKFTASDQLLAIIGPCISMHNYEVDVQIYQDFIKMQQEYSKFFKELGGDKFLLDLQGLVKSQLEQVSIITQLSNINTYNNDRYFSYRYSMHNGVIEKKRILTAIFFQ